MFIIRKQTVSEIVRGIKISFIGLRVAPLKFMSLPTFKKQVKKFEKYIIPIKPKSPVLGKTIKIKIIIQLRRLHIFTLKYNKK